MLTQLNLFPNGLSEVNESGRIQAISTVEEQGRKIHRINDEKVAIYFSQFFICPFLNAGSIQVNLSKIKTPTLLSPDLSVRSELAVALTPYFEEIFLNENVWRKTRTDVQKLFNSWQEQKDAPINLTSSISSLFSRWGVRSFLGFFQDIDDLSQHLQILFDTDFGKSISEIQKIQAELRVAALIRKNIEHQQTIPGSLADQLQKLGYDNKAIAAHFYVNLCLVHQTGSLLMTYVLWILAANPELQQYYRKIAMDAEQILEESEDMEKYQETLAPFDALIEKWHREFFPAKWTSTMPYDAIFTDGEAEHILKRGDTVSYELESTPFYAIRKKSFRCGVDGLKHHCHQEKNYGKVLRIMLGMILAKSTFTAIDNPLDFELRVMPKAKIPIMINLQKVEANIGET